MVSEGTFAVGPGGHYASWAAAAADLAPTLTGDLSFKQVGLLTETTTVTFAPDLNGFTLVLSNCEPPFGAPEAGFETFLSALAARLEVLPSGVGTVEVRRLFLRATTSLGGADMLKVAPTAGATARVHDTLLDANGFFADGLEVGGGGAATYEVWNIQAWDTDGIGISVVLPGAVFRVENCTTYLCLGGGFAYADDPSVTLRNGAAFDSAPGADYAPAVPAMATTTNNASSDASAPGAAPLIGLVAAVQYVSLVDTSIHFLRVAPGSALIASGAVVLIAGHTVGSRGNARPPLPTRGCDEFSSPLYVTLGNCDLPIAVITGATEAFGVPAQFVLTGVI